MTRHDNSNIRQHKTMYDAMRQYRARQGYKIRQYNIRQYRVSQDNIRQCKTKKHNTIFVNISHGTTREDNTI